MDIFEVLNLIKKGWKTIGTGVLIGVFAGTLAFYFFKPKYVATGSIFTYRKVDTSTTSYFAYEGYYSQQTAISFTNTLFGIFEGDDLKKTTLQALKLPETEQEYRKLAKNMRIKKAGPQLITVTYKNADYEKASTTWTTLVQSAYEEVKELNDRGDKNLGIVALGEPVVKKEFSSIWVNTFVGGFLGLSLSIFAVLAFTKPKGTQE